LKHKNGIPGPGQYDFINTIRPDGKMNVSKFSSIIPFVMNNEPRFKPKSMIYNYRL